MHADNLQKEYMGRNILHRLALVVTVVAALFLSGCGGDSQKQERLHREAEDIVSEAYEVRDYQRIIEIVDSLKQLGSMSEGKAYYWLGYAYDRLMQKRMAELYWKKGIAAVENSTEVEDVKVYAAIVQRLTVLMNVWGEYEAAHEIALPAIEQLEKLDCDSTSDYANLLIYEGCYQSRFGIREAKANEYLVRGYRLHLDLIQRHPYFVYYRDAIIGLGIICNTYLDIHKYGKAFIWTERIAELIREYEKVPDGRPDYAEKQWARYYINSAIALEGVGRKDEAAKAYQLFEKTSFSRTAEGQYTLLDAQETNAPIGLWPDLEYVGEEMDLPSGSMMLLYTDGLNEAENSQQEQYGEDRIIQLMASYASRSSHDIVDALKADADQFRDGAEQNDDLTMLALSVV